MASDNIKNAQAWAVKNPKICIYVGFFIIVIGLIVNHLYDDTQTLIWLILAHAFIILGEAVMVTFFLHLFVEQQNHEHSLQMLEKLGGEGKAIFEHQSALIGQEFSKLITDLKKQADITIDNINDNLFAAILKEKLPHQIVRAVLDSQFFNTEILRRNLRLSFDINAVSDTTVKLTQRTEFDMEYIFGSAPDFKYTMPIIISNTPLAKYTLKDTGFRRYIDHSVSTESWETFTVNNGMIQNGDNYSLKDPIHIPKNGKIKVYQDIEATYNVGDGGIVDNYFANSHTINIRIDITNLPNDHEFKLYPTFPSNHFKNPQKTGMIISYEHIEFLVPGQGFGFSISKKQ